MRRVTCGVSVVVGLSLIAGCGSGSASSPLSDETWERLRAEGVPPDLVYTVELPGYELAEQSVGVVGDGGLGSVYVSGQGAQVELRVDRGGFSDELCSTTPVSNFSDSPLAAPPTAAVSCERDEAGWYRAAGGRQEYVIVRDVHVLRLAGPRDQVDRTTLATALTNAQQVDAPAAPPDDTAPSTTIRRGDLPGTGDGAPENDVGAGG